MSTPSARTQRSIFCGAFFITLILLFALLGFVLVASSYHAYGLAQPEPPLEVYRTPSAIVVTLLEKKYTLTPTDCDNVLDTLHRLSPFVFPRGVRVLAQLYLFGEAYLASLP